MEPSRRRASDRASLADGPDETGDSNQVHCGEERGRGEQAICSQVPGTEANETQTIAAMQKKKGYLARVTLDAAEHKGETMGLDVSSVKTYFLVDTPYQKESNN